MKKRTLSLVSVLAAMLVSGCGGSTNSSKNSASSNANSQHVSSVKEDKDRPAGYTDILNSPEIAARTIPSDMGLEARKDFKSAFTSDATTFDYLSNMHQSNSEYYANFVDNLLEHDQYGKIRGALAEKAYYNEDCTRIRFVLRKGVKWVNSAGVEVAEVTANDFAAGLRHLLDAKGGAENLAFFIVGAEDYARGVDTDFSHVGFYKIDDYTFEYILKESVPYFHTFFEYTVFLPLNEEFFISMGGAFGDEYVANDCEFGIPTEPRSLLYCGPYILAEYTKQQRLKMIKNEKYWDIGNVNIDTVTYTYNSGTDSQALVDMFMAGELSSLGVGESNYEMIQKEESLKDCIFDQGTGTTTFYFNWNLNRSTYQVGNCKSAKLGDTAAQANTRTAIENENFRKAVLSAIKKTENNSLVDGKKLAQVCIRNTYTTPEFVSTSEDEVVNGVEHPAGSQYYEMLNREMKAQNDINNDNYAKYASVYNPDTGKETSGDELTTFADREGSYFNEDAALELKAKAIRELTGKVTFPVKVDYLVYTAGDVSVAQANAIKASIENILGRDFIQIDLQGTSNLTEYENSHYQARTGADMNFDLSGGTGWGPDYGDPRSFLHTFAWNGDMATSIGFDDTAADRAIYDRVLGDFYAKFLEADKETDTSLRYAKFAACEAELLASGVIMPNTTDGGGQAVSRIMTRTNQRSFYGTDDSRFKYMIIVDKPITTAQRQAFIDSWQAEYDAAFGN